MLCMLPTRSLHPKRHSSAWMPWTLWTGRDVHAGPHELKSTRAMLLQMASLASHGFGLPRPHGFPARACPLPPRPCHSSLRARKCSPARAPGGGPRQCTDASVPWLGYHAARSARGYLPPLSPRASAVSNGLGTVFNTGQIV